ncbi:MAG: RNA polymerase sigma-70 factor [Ginsengibacter sp.]
MRDYLSYNYETLLELLSLGDELAFTEIYDRFGKKLFAIAYNRLKEVQESEDIVHDVFASLWANRNKVDVKSLENYLATATKYTVFARIKRKERERLYNETSQHSPIIELNIETSLHYKYILEAVQNEIERLPEKCKLVFKYSRKDQLPVKEIAEKLCISPKTVENQLNKALRQLKLVAKTFLISLFSLFY